MRNILALSVLIVLPLGLRAECNAGNGKQLFDNKCGICHQLDAAAGHSVGPNLHGVVGRGIGKASGFGYSQAMANSRGSWAPDTLMDFLKAPQKAIPGTAMPFQGLKSEADRQQIVCHLQSSE